LLVIMYNNKPLKKEGGMKSYKVQILTITCTYISFVLYFSIKICRAKM